MNKNRYIFEIIIICTFVVLLTSCKEKDNTNQKFIKNQNNIETEHLPKIKLNHIAINAAGNSIVDVEFENEISAKIKEREDEQIEIYSVQPQNYSKEEIEELLKVCFDDEIVEESMDEDMIIYMLKKGGYITYYINSGGLSYSRTTDGNYNLSSKVISNEKLIADSKEFIKKSKLYDMDDIVFMHARPSMYVESDGDKKIERYEVSFQKKPPKGIDGYVGSMLGISIDFDSDGEVIGFVSYDRNVEKKKIKYPSKNVEDIEKDILEDKNVMIDFEENTDKVSFSEMKYVLYCDSVLEKQNNMVPHYEMIDKDNNVAAVLPAVDDEYISVD